MCIFINFRYNSSIEGQKKKNQRKKSKKRSQDRRKSESEAEDEISNSSQVNKNIICLKKSNYRIIENMISYVPYIPIRGPIPR